MYPRQDRDIILYKILLNVWCMNVCFVLVLIIDGK